MTKLCKPLLIESIKAKTYIPKYRFVGFDGSVCDYGVRAIGVSDVETEQGQYAPIGIIGIFLVETATDLEAGIKIASDSLGRAIRATSGEKTNGYSIDSATKEGEIIRIVRL